MFFDSVQSSNDSMRIKKICFSSATTPFMTQVSIESELDKRGGKSFGPPGSQKIEFFTFAFTENIKFIDNIWQVAKRWPFLWTI